MEITSKVFSGISMLLFLGSFFPYIVAIIKKEIQPTVASWMIWAVIDGITVLALYQKNSLNVIAVLALFGSLTVACLALFLGEKGWSFFDKVCVGLALLAVVLWLISNEPLWGLILSQIAGLIAAIPTFISTFEDPTRESRLGWMMNWFACIFLVISLGLVAQEGISIWIQPAFFVLIQSTEILLLFKIVRKKQS